MYSTLAPDKSGSFVSEIEADWTGIVIIVLYYYYYRVFANRVAPLLAPSSSDTSLGRLVKRFDQ